MADDDATTHDPGTDPEGDGGSYTARPSKEPPAEGTTRDEDAEATPRIGGAQRRAERDQADGA